MHKSNRELPAGSGQARLNLSLNCVRVLAEKFQRFLSNSLCGAKDDEALLVIEATRHEMNHVWHVLFCCCFVLIWPPGRLVPKQAFKGFCQIIIFLNQHAWSPHSLCIHTILYPLYLINHELKLYLNSPF